ncbi:ATP-grasp domain-containing protein [Mycolicibacterium sp.]|uniref:ATP-grasp domain-containing protein n=1 Tax=Mycolicibacterium sp. TaxID=2320850 RepID=UPI00355FB640
MDTAAASGADTVLWCPGAWAAAAVSRHRNLRLSSAGPRWLDHLPAAVTGREVDTATVGQLRAILPVAETARVFAKFPETKHERFEARVRSPEELAADLDQLPESEPVQLQSPVRFDYEVRCWVLGAKVVAHAVYFPGAPREEWAGLEHPARSAAAVKWLGRVLAAGDVTVPDAVVVDAGWCTDPVVGPPGWRIVEANAAWSADWYIPDAMDAVVATVAASQLGVSDRWRWRPSPLLVHCSKALARR